jgi:Tol biopolymer transport system component
VLVESPLDIVATDWSADGRFLFYQVLNDPRTGRDLWVLPLTEDRKPFVWLNGSFEERHGQFSPDGRWVAYGSNESGRQEVYVRPFPKSDGQWQVSTAGGIWPRWRRDGKQLDYIAPDGKLMAAPISVNGATLEPGAPVALFQTRIVGGGTNIDLGRQYDVASDGRFLINVATDEATASPITVIQNWAGASPR